MPRNRFSAGIQDDPLAYSPAKVSWATAQFVQRPPLFVFRLAIYVFAGAFLAGVLFCAFFSVAVSIEARGFLISEQSVLPIRASMDFKVEELKVVNNQQVSKGQVLLIGKDHLEPSDFERLTRDTEQLIRIVEDARSGECAHCLSQLRAMTDTVLQVKGNTSLSQALLPIQEMVQELYTAFDQGTNVTAVKASLQDKIDLASSKLREIRARGAEQLLAVEVEQLIAEVSSARGQLAEKRYSLDTQRQQVSNRLLPRLTGLLAFLQDFKAQRTLVAPVDGTVSELNLSGSGQFVSSGQELMQIVPKETSLVVELHIENKDISRVKPGMRTRIKLDALPEREFGEVTGEVVTVPPNRSQAQGAVAGTPSVYKVLAKIDRKSLTRNGVEYPFRLGMTLNGLVIERYESLLRLGIRRVLQIGDDTGI